MQQCAGNFNRKSSLLISFISTSISVPYAFYVYSIYIASFSDLFKHPDKNHFLLFYKLMSEKVVLIICLKVG